jgi:hypothetical protein
MARQWLGAGTLQLFFWKFRYLRAYASVYGRKWDHLAGSGTLNNFQKLNFRLILHPTKGDSPPR